MVLFRAALVFQQDSCHPLPDSPRRSPAGAGNHECETRSRAQAGGRGGWSPELAAGIRRVKGSKRLGVRLGNWLTAEQARSLWQLPNAGTVKSKRDRAILAVLLGCGLRRRELSDLTLDHLQRREEHWAIMDLVGK